MRITQLKLFWRKFLEVLATLNNAEGDYYDRCKNKIILQLHNINPYFSEQELHDMLRDNNLSRVTERVSKPFIYI